MRKQIRRSASRLREADQRLCFRYQIVESFFFLNLKFIASSHLLWLYRQGCVGPGRKPRRPVFSRGSFAYLTMALIQLSWRCSVAVYYIHFENCGSTHADYCSVIYLMRFSCPFSFQNTSLGEEKAGHCASNAITWLVRTHYSLSFIYSF